MSLTDKVIEELRDATDGGGVIDREEASEWAGVFNRAAAAADAPFGAQRMLAFAVVAEAFALGTVWFGMRYLLWLVDVVYATLIGTAFVFFTGFFGAFAAYKLYKEYIARDLPYPPADDPMSDIADYDTTQTDFTLYFISALAGIANVVLVFVLLTL
jgi:hypothetical protein